MWDIYLFNFFKDPVQLQYKTRKSKFNCLHENRISVVTEKFKALCLAGGIVSKPNVEK